MQNQDFLNLTQIISHIKESYQNPRALNFIENEQWTHISTEEFVDKIEKLSLGLNKIGLKRGGSFGIISYPNPIWVMMDSAIISSGAVTVPIFPNISKRNFEFEIENANVEFVFCDSFEGLQAINDSKHKFLKIIIYGFEAKQDNIVHFDDLLRTGELICKEQPNLYQNLTDQIKEGDVATIIYTSGSTGVPKGVELTHANLISQIKGTKKLFPLDDKQDSALSFLPLAHIFERMVSLYYIASGISIYFADDVQNVGRLVKEIKPTIMTVVPRVLEKVYNKMRSNVDESGLIKRIIGIAAFEYALKPQSRKTFMGIIFDKLVYKKLRAALGGKFRTMICGSAPLSLELEYFFKNIGINLYIGYGTTESSPVIAVNYAQFNKLGTVGKAFPDVEVKVTTDGELLARGPNIMKGYHNEVEKTAATIDEDGWLRTGDLVKIDEEGYIKIIGRKKELFKTAYGKYVSPVPIEQKLVAQGEFLLAAVIIAEGRKFVSCLLFPDFAILDNYKKKVKMDHLSDEDFLSSEFIRHNISQLVDNVNKDLNHWERTRKYCLVHDAISVATGELTPSMKIARLEIEKKYMSKIENFYK